MYSDCLKDRATHFTEIQRRVELQMIHQLICPMATIGLLTQSTKVHRHTIQVTLSSINTFMPILSCIDDRPVGSYNPADPNDSPNNYKFTYVAQCLLEDLIECLKELKASKSLIEALESNV